MTRNDQGNDRMTPRPNLPPENEDTYEGRVCARLKELRVSKGWTMEELRERLAAIGVDIPSSTLYSYERGSARSGGVDIPIRLLPAIARVYGYTTAGGWLPAK